VNSTTMTRADITRAMLQHTSTWPLVTHLCMKKPKERPDNIFPKCGIIRAVGYDGGVRLAIKIENHPDRMHGEFVEAFNSIADVIAAGWEVD